MSKDPSDERRQKAPLVHVRPDGTLVVSDRPPPPLEPDRPPLYVGPERRGMADAMANERELLDATAALTDGFDRFPRDPQHEQNEQRYLAALRAFVWMATPEEKAAYRDAFAAIRQLSDSLPKVPFVNG